MAPLLPVWHCIYYFEHKPKEEVILLSFLSKSRVRNSSNGNNIRALWSSCICYTYVLTLLHVSDHYLENCKSCGDTALLCHMCETIIEGRNSSNKTLIRILRPLWTFLASSGLYSYFAASFKSLSRNRNCEDISPNVMSSLLAFRFRRRSEKKTTYFQDGRHGAHRRFRIGAILAIFDLQVTPMLHMNFQVNWPFGSGEEAKNWFSRWPPWRPFLDFR